MSIKQEELTLVIEAIILPFVLPILQKSLDDLDERFLSQLYIWSGKYLYSEVESDIRKINNTLRTCGIRVWENESKRENDSRFYRYSKGGFEGEVIILRELLRIDIKSRIQGYIARIENVISGPQNKKP